jgi:hypothetical protein
MIAFFIQEGLQEQQKTSFFTSEYILELYSLTIQIIPIKFINKKYKLVKIKM